MCIMYVPNCRYVGLSVLASYTFLVVAGAISELSVGSSQFGDSIEPPFVVAYTIIYLCSKKHGFPVLYDMHCYAVNVP